MKHQIVVADFQARLEAENALLDIILDLPYQQQVRWLKKYGMADLIPQPMKTIETTAEVVREPNQLQVLALDEWRQEQSANGGRSNPQRWTRLRCMLAALGQVCCGQQTHGKVRRSPRTMPCGSGHSRTRIW
jgi:hypothetical protein